MAILAGKFIYGAALELQSQVFWKPSRARKIIVRSCSKGRESSSEFPVRYTPKRSSNFDKLKNPTPPPRGPNDYDHIQFRNPNSSNVEFSNSGRSSRMGYFVDEKSLANDIEPGNLKRKEKNMLNEYVKSEMEEERDHKWRHEESKFMEELDERDVMEGPEEALDELEPHNGKYGTTHITFRSSNAKEEAEKMAIRLLAARAFTALELKKKLLGKKHSHEIVDGVISDFQNRGLINDSLYAETFSRSRWSSSSWGPRRIKQGLINKGVNEMDAEKAIQFVLEDGESCDDQVSRLGLSKASMDHLFAQASKQWLRGSDVTNEKRKSRIITWLQYRGFNWGVTNFILKKLQSEYPPYNKPTPPDDG